jgi:hypothetical protein
MNRSKSYWIPIQELRDISYGSGTTLNFVEAGNNLSGTLTVSDGTHTANLTLAGQYVTANFTKQSDGAGGTKVGDPPLEMMTDPGPPALLRNPTPAEPAATSPTSASDPSPQASNPFNRLMGLLGGGHGIWANRWQSLAGAQTSGFPPDAGIARLVQAVAAFSADQAGPQPPAYGQGANTLEQPHTLASPH